MQWFKHDIGSYRSDQIQALRIRSGSAAIDLYYALVEEIYENEGSLTLGENLVKTCWVLHGLLLGWAGFLELLESIEECELLDVSKTVVDGEVKSVTVSSRRASREIAEMSRLAEISRQNGKSGGRPKNGNLEKTQQVPSRNPAATQRKPDYKTIKTIEKEVSKDTSKKSSDENSDAINEIVGYLNETVGSRFMPKTPKTRSLINARLKEGYTVDDFKAVIDCKFREWRGGDMAKYLRPETLFSPKFEGYLNQARSEGARRSKYAKYA